MLLEALEYALAPVCILALLCAIGSIAYDYRALPLRALEPLIITLLMFGFTPPACFPRWGVAEVKYLLSIDDFEEEEPEIVRIPDGPRTPRYIGPRSRRPSSDDGGRHDELALAAEPGTRDKRR
ncbi:hypothetical protein HOI83_01310 [Candidatus Uhrbacteria bacterium]|jgi:hypothetical protein|nr:hypothetical protein [Candidatus Uhrbacteria bacterium]